MCARCGRPASACVCAWVAPVQTAVSLLILQHPMETSNAKGSARLLQLSAPGAVMAEGETFGPASLNRMLHSLGRTPILLYPHTPGDASMGIALPPALDPALLATPQKIRLVVLDGTWRKSRKMLYQNPLLLQLPRLPLTQMPPSQYLIRKAHAPDQLSTLEATCYALAQLEGNAAAVEPLLASFQRFVAHFQATGGRIGDATP
jgi:DTW domain-containing protein YfiP